MSRSLTTLPLALAPIFLALAFSFPAGCERKPALTRTELLGFLTTNAIFASYQHLAETSHQLVPALETLADEPTAENLSRAQQAWGHTYVAWRQTTAFNIGPVDELRVTGAMGLFRPTSAPIEKALEHSEPITPAYIDLLGSTARGLPALEFLLFEPGAAEEFQHPDQSRRSNYALELARDISRRTRQLAAKWDPAQSTYPATFFNDPKQLDALINHLIAVAEDLKNDSLGRPLGKRTSGTRTQPQWVEASRSNHGTQGMVATLNSYEFLLQGGRTKAPQPGLQTYLNQLGSPLADRLPATVHQAKEQLLALPKPLHEMVASQPAELEPLYATLNDLLILTKAELTAALGVTVTFTDNDGD